MKAIKIFILAIMSIIIVPLMSCSEDDEPLLKSVPPVEFVFIIDSSDMYVDDIAFDVNEITIKYNEKVYSLNSPNESSPNLFEPELKCKLMESGEYYLRFGGFVGVCTEESFTIDYGNGVTDTFTFSSGGIFSPNLTTTIWFRSNKFEIHGHVNYIKLNNWEYYILT